jgi:hypothetical protein
MRYRTPKTNWKDTYLFKERKWCRPAAIKTLMKNFL